MTENKQYISDPSDDGLDLSHVKYVDLPDAIVIAASDCRGDIVEYLLNSGIPIETRDEYGCTALMAAVSEGSDYLVSMLLVRGANPNALNDDGDAPLDIACYLNRNKIVEMLLSKGAKKKDGPSQREIDDDAIYEAIESANAVKRLASWMITKKNETS